MQVAHEPQQEILSKRLPVVIGVLLFVSALLVARLASFQFQLSPEVENYLLSLRNSSYLRTLQLAADRGRIFDRDGETLAVNTLKYRIAVSPNIISNPQRTATQIAGILNMNELEVYQALIRPEPYVVLATDVDADKGHEIDELDVSGILIEPMPDRSYPQGTLAAQILGFVGGDLEGYYGVEGYYQDQLAGQSRTSEVSNIPFILPDEQEAGSGKDIVLTIDRDIQFLAESELQRAIAETGSQRGTIIIMNPRNGDILAMASYPSFDPNAYYDVSDARVLVNPAISEQFEPGSVMKVLTMAAGIETSTITAQDTYVDQGRFDVGGISIYNWDRAAHGVVDMTQVLVQSLNVGVATISTRMGPTNFYTMMDNFGIGRATGVDLEGEAAGTMHVPGEPDWSESHIGTDAYGQGVSVTPLQLLTAVNAIANDGLMMQPHVVHEIHDGDQVYYSQPSALGRPISSETARIVTEMMVATVRDGVDQAGIPGYTVAGKTGTAEIPSPLGYEANATIASFVGFLPADDPQVSVFIKLDRPTSSQWGSQTAAPAFRRMVERLVVLLEIPNDDIRVQLAAQGGSVINVDR